ncbi:M15 family metallopeptidase [Deinococcus radiomollis]|uniref:M15 family metallopeptidase n=1 Tax=Deinococcus radiomollis TaxID=468916 RepID=UPI0038915EEE
MKRLGALLTLLIVVSQAGVGAQVSQKAVSPQHLLSAYPQFLKGLDQSTLVWKDGTRTPLSGGHPFTSAADRLDRPDLSELLRQPYPSCTPLHTPAYAEDPGRARPAAFFDKMYGNSPAAVRSHLVSVNWFGQRVLFSRVNGANLALEAVARDLATRPELRNYLTPSAGTYLWRVVAGSGRQSAHSWGIAIDLNTRYSDYWQWEGHKEFARNIGYKNRMPQAVVWAFERHGFVWGGRWYHHDTMHFEFRPELSFGAC